MSETCRRCGHTGDDVQPAREVRTCLSPNPVHVEAECTDWKACYRREYGPQPAHRKGSP